MYCTIVGEWSVFENEKCLLFDNHSENNERVIIFSTLNNLKLLTYANTWYADGNFGLAPKHFSQLYIIRIEKYSEFVTVLYCLLEKKSIYLRKNVQSYFISLRKEKI